MVKKGKTNQKVEKLEKAGNEKVKKLEKLEKAGNEKVKKLEKLEKAGNEKVKLKDMKYRTLQRMAIKSNIKGNLPKEEMISQILEKTEKEKVIPKKEEKIDNEKKVKAGKDRKREVTFRDLTQKSLKNGKKITNISQLLVKDDFSRVKKTIGNKLFINGYHWEKQDKSPKRVTGFPTFSSMKKSQKNTQGEIISISTGEGNNKGSHFLVIIPENTLKVKMVDGTFRELTQGNNGREEFLPTTSNHGRIYKLGWILSHQYNLVYSRKPEGRYRESNDHNMNLEEKNGNWFLYSRIPQKRIHISEPLEIWKNKGINGLIHYLRDKLENGKILKN